ncbi:MAG: adenosylmethionine--8-amino-7-oxononanoate transaminase [Methylococcales bacterium]|nr:adenosylmethionine--8-amino-7-oxononanoate transaminase [Methylococcales bacterium]
MSNQSLSKRDLSVLWHPCTQMKDHESSAIIPIKKGQGVWLEDFDGNRYLDAISSWWVNLFGHANPHINAALKDQIDKLEQVIFAGFSHEPAIYLAEQLVAVTPKGLERCFYADNGSAAVEVALKMSFHYWRNNNQTLKTKFITLENSYHGETLGALAVGNVALYKETYAPLLMDVITVPGPDCYYRESDESWADYSTRRFALMEHTLQQHSESVCAVIIEPLVQCAGNMRMYDPIYLTLLRAACDKYQVHLIVDEIAVGFGRTGTLFACEQADISPDFMCLSKGLTGGYLPLSAVMTTNDIYQAFYDDYHKLNAFLHSHSYTGNALACRAGLATLEIFQQNKIIENNKRLAAIMKQMTVHFIEHAHVAEVRQTGMIVAIELVKNKQTGEPYPWQERLGLKVYQYALSKGVLLRPLGNVIYFMPPYIITEEELLFIAKVAFEGIQWAIKD